MSLERCAEYGKLFRTPVEKAGERSTQCPRCGSIGRAIVATQNETINVGRHETSTKRRHGIVRGFTESNRNARSTFADLQEDGSVVAGFQGAPPQGEEDTLTACRVLIARLNELGDSWSDIRSGPEPAELGEDLRTFSILAHGKW